MTMSKTAALKEARRRVRPVGNGLTIIRDMPDLHIFREVQCPDEEWARETRARLVALEAARLMGIEPGDEQYDPVAEAAASGGPIEARLACIVATQRQA